MKAVRQKIAIAITALLVVTIVVSCEETDVLNQSGTPDRTQAIEVPSPYSISNGFLKAKLDHYAYEAYAGLYGVALSPENSQIIDKATLLTWVKTNEKNKHPIINRENRTALAAMEDAHILLIQAPAGSSFQASVFVLSSLKSFVITDVVDREFGSRLKVVKEGIGFTGNGYLDNAGNLPCVCAEEVKIIFAEATYTKCGQCPNLGGGGHYFP